MSEPMDRTDLELRIALLTERARRAFKLPITADVTVEERVSEIERLLADLHAIAFGLALRIATDKEARFQEIEAVLLENEKRRGILPE